MRLIFQVLVLCLTPLIIQQASSYCVCTNQSCPSAGSSNCQCLSWACNDPNDVPPVQTVQTYVPPPPKPAYIPKGNEASPDGQCWFSIRDGGKTWDESQSLCRAEGRTLATFSSEGRRQWITNYLNAHNNNAQGQAWIGGQKCLDGSGTWCWIGTSDKIQWAGAGTYFWNAINPSGDGPCVSLLTTEGKLNDAPCTLGFMAVCMDLGCHA